MLGEADSARQLREAMELLGREGIDRARALDRLFPMVYGQLRSIAERQFANESPNHTLQPTAVVHEAWLRLAAECGPQWSEPGYFFSAAAEAMRRILIEHARRKNRPARASWRARVALDVDDVSAPPGDDTDWEEFDAALEAFRGVDGRAAEVVRLRVYAGLSVAQTAAALEISAATVKREWVYACAWLRDRLDGAES